MPDQLKSRNLVPFKKRNGRYNIPGLASEQEAMIDRVDADLSPEEQGFISHYLGYADAFLRSAEHTVPEPQEKPGAQNEKEEIKEHPCQAKGNRTSKAA
jgi:hypothetical protein